MNLLTNQKAIRHYKHFGTISANGMTQLDPPLWGVTDPNLIFYQLQPRIEFSMVSPLFDPPGSTFYLMILGLTVVSFLITQLSAALGRSLSLPPSLE